MIRMTEQEKIIKVAKLRELTKNGEKYNPL